MVQCHSGIPFPTDFLARAREVEKKCSDLSEIVYEKIGGLSVGSGNVWRD